jgi:GT2 family glycosyltransferase
LLRNWLTKIGIARVLKVESLQSQPKTRIAPVVKGAAMIVRRTAYLQVGPMDETTLGYGEEVDWHLRMRQTGWQVAFVAEAKITHFGQGQARLQLEGQMLVEDRKAILNYWLKYRPRWETIVIRLSMILFHSFFSLCFLFFDPTRSRTHRRVAYLGLAWTRKG